MTSRTADLDDAYAISEAEIEAALDGYPEKKKDYPERSLAALRAAIDDYRGKRASGAITDAMLEQARATARAEAVAPEPAPAPAAAGAVTTIDLRA